MDQHLELPSIDAPINYQTFTGEKPVTETKTPNGKPWRNLANVSTRIMKVRDGRPLAGALSIDREGFEFVDHDTQVEDFYDRAEVERVYYPEVADLIERRYGAARVLIFDHTVRNGDEGEQDRRGVREPVKMAHNDYTDWSGPQRVRDLLAPDQAEALLRNRLAVIQMWRPINTTVERDPLAICDARALAPEDLIAADRKYPDRVGEIYQVAYNPGHVWYYFPRMRRDEALLFKCYDSKLDGRARFTAHTGFEDPTSPPGAPPRESIEIRALAFFPPEGGADAA
jgi:hypothetical protein